MPNLSEEQKKAIRRIVSGQDKEPVELGMTSDAIEVPEEEHADMSVPNRFDIDGNRVIKKFQEFYPVHFNHVVAEVKAEMLSEQLQELSGE